MEEETQYPAGEAVAIDEERRAFFDAMYLENRRVVFAAIWKIIVQCTDLGADLDPVTESRAELNTATEIEREVWSKVWIDLDRWAEPPRANRLGREPAKLSTRLYDFARLQAMGWKKDRLRNRARHVSHDDGVMVESFLFDKAHGYGKFYPESLKPHPLDETPFRLRAKEQTPEGSQLKSPRLLCGKCNELRAVCAGALTDPAFVLECGHSRGLAA